MRDVVVQLARHRGIALVSRDNHLLGVFTAGDLTRLAERERDYFEWPVEQVMTDAPHSCGPEDLGAAALGFMERKGIMALPVLDDADVIVGVVHLHDLMRAGAV